MEKSGRLHTPAALAPGKNAGPHWIRGRVGITSHLDGAGQENTSCPRRKKGRRKAQKTKGVRNYPSHDLHSTVQCSAGEINTRKITDESVGSEKGALLAAVVSKFCEEIPFQVSKFYYHIFPLYHSTTIPHLEPTSDPQTLLALMTYPYPPQHPPTPASFRLYTLSIAQ